MIPDKDLADDVLDEIIAGAKTSMEQYLALSLKAERAAGNSPAQGGSRCSIKAAPALDSSPKTAESRCGNSPVIPEGYRLQPISEYEAMCATVNSGEWSQRWIPVSERMPEGSEEVLCAKEFDGPGDWRKKVGYRLAGKWTVYGASWTPTHWMPLPAAPQEVKGE
ncbi:TPA: DUF551 domain-containing protein [Klebsiella michiganensis]